MASHLCNSNVKQDDYEDVQFVGVAKLKKIHILVIVALNEKNTCIGLHWERAFTKHTDVEN